MTGGAGRSFASREGEFIFRISLSIYLHIYLSDLEDKLLPPLQENKSNVIYLH